MTVTVRPLHITRFGSKRAKIPTIDSGPLTWDELVELLQVWAVRQEKDGPLWSPAEYAPGKPRGVSNVLRVHAIVLDMDDGVTPDEFRAEWAGIEHVIHSTYSHTPATPKWRAVFPLAEPVSAADWSDTYRALSVKLGHGHADSACKDASRIFYLPADDGAMPSERIYRRENGRWIDPGPYLPEKHKAAILEPTHAIYDDAPKADPEMIRRMLDKALAGEFAGAPGRNIQGFQLACQLRDNGVPKEEALRVLTLGYAPQVSAQDAQGKNDPYTEEEAAHSVDTAYARKPAGRTAWARPAQQIDISDLSPGAGRSSQDTPQPDLKRAADFLESAPDPEMLVPPGWVLAWTGTGKLVTTKDPDGNAVIQIRRVADAPVLITGRAIDINTREQYLVAAWPGPRRRWEHELAPREKLRHARGLQTLSARGFPYLEVEGKQLASYLAAAETVNADRLPTATLTSKLGWQGAADDGVPFLLGHTLIRSDGRVDTAAALDPREARCWTEDAIAWHTQSEGEDQLVRAYRVAGTWAGELATLEMLRPYPVALCWWYLGFCPMLLDIFNCPNFVTELAYPTSTGKTTLLRGVASIYGCPDERTEKALVQKWDVTQVYAERAAGVCNHLPLLLDDTSHARAGMIKSLTYSVAAGRGRGRGTIGGLAETAYWRTVLFSTSEHPLSADTQAGGVRTRTLSFQVAPFGDQTKETGKVARVLGDAFCRHYGHAAPRFLSWVLRHRDRWDEWRRGYQSWVEWYADHPGTPESGRLAQYAALGTITGQLAHWALQLPWEYDNPMRSQWGHLAEHAKDAAGAERAIELVVSWARSHEREFIGRGSPAAALAGTGHSAPQGVAVAGAWAPGEESDLCFYPHVLQGILRGGGFVPEAILADWRVRKIIAADEGRFTSRIQIAGTRQKFVVIRSQYVREPEGDEE